MKGTGVVRRVDDFEKVVIPRRYAGICVFGKATPHVQHLHPRNNSKERSRISTYGAEIEDCANNQGEQFFCSPFVMSRFCPIVDFII